MSSLNPRGTKLNELDDMASEGNKKNCNLKRQLATVTLVFTPGITFKMSLPKMIRDKAVGQEDLAYNNQNNFFKK